MTLKNIVTEFKEHDETVLTRLFELYPDQEKSRDGYKDVINALKKLKLKNTKLKIDISHVTEEFDGEPCDYWHVSGVEDGSTESWAIEYVEWEEWLAMEFTDKTLEELSLLDIYCYCLWEMTWSGFNQAEIQKEISEIMGRVDEVKSGEAELIPLSKVKEHLEEKINGSKSR